MRFTLVFFNLFLIVFSLNAHGMALKKPNPCRAYTQKILVAENTPYLHGQLMGECSTSTTVRYALFAQPTSGRVELNSETGAFVFIPNQDVLGTGFFQFTVAANGDVSIPGTVTTEIRHNYIVNGSFESGSLNPWEQSYLTFESGHAEWQPGRNGMVVDFPFSSRFMNRKTYKATETNNTETLLTQKVMLEQGKTYIFSMNLFAANPGIDNIASSAMYVTQGYSLIAGGPALYSEFHIPTMEANRQLSFTVQETGQYEINIQVLEGGNLRPSGSPVDWYVDNVYVIEYPW